MPNNFGKTALGAVHSNYKTEPCKNFQETGECKFGEGCSFFHNEEERRKLIDPLPHLPEGVTLPPMPEKLKNYKQKQAAANGYFKPEQSSDAMQAMLQPPMPHYANMQNSMPPMIQISSLTDILSLGGFNPNKYLTAPQPVPYGVPQGYQMPGYGQMPPHMQYGNPAPFNPNAFNPNQAKGNKSTDQKGEKKDKKKNGDKKYVSK